MELTRTLEQRNFVAHYHNCLELCLKEAAYTFNEGKMPICQKRTASLFCRHFFISRLPPGASEFSSQFLHPERVSMTSKIY